MKDQSTDTDVETIWNDFWKPLVTNEDGTINLEQIKRELFDYKTLMHNAAVVYQHVTGGKISKLNTLPNSVIDVADEHYQQLADDYAADISREQAERSID